MISLFSAYHKRIFSSLNPAALSPISLHSLLRYNNPLASRSYYSIHSTTMTNPIREEIPASVESHRSTIFLSFSPKCPAYAEYATYIYLAEKYPQKAKSFSFRLGLSPDLLQSQSSLIIPKGYLSPEKVSLSGKRPILRCLGRLFGAETEFPEASNPLLRFELEQVFQQLIENPSQLTPKSTYLSGSQLTLPDILAWDLSLTSKEKLSSAVQAIANQVSSIKAFQDAKREIDTVISRAPILDRFRYHVADRVATLLSAPYKSVLELLEEPRDRRYGDVALPVPRLKLPGNPIEHAKKISEQFGKDEYILEVSSTGPFVNFKFNKELYKQGIRHVIAEGSKFGHNSSGFGQLAVVEYSSPNIAKPFHAGHLRSTIIGSFVEKAMKACGYSTLSINYLGDWGKQYGLLAVGFEKYGSREELKADPIVHLFQVYVKINADAKEDPTIHDQARSYFKRMEDGDEEALKLWKEFRDLSIVAYRNIYARLNVNFDLYSGESVYSLSQMQSVLDELTAKGLLVPDQGALIVDLKEEKLGTAVIGKTDGSMLYLSRDIAAAIDRQAKYQYDRMFYVVGTQQNHHFNQLFKILELMGKDWAQKLEHVGFGLIKSKDGNMSTRKGTVVFLQDILDQVKEEMHAVMQRNEVKYKQIPDPEKVSDTVGISSIMIQDMSARRTKDYEFDWNRMLSFEGDTGPYLQYAHSRLCSIERQAPEDYTITEKNVYDIDLSLLSEPQAIDLMGLILEYPDVLKNVISNLEPVTLVNYALRLSHGVSSAYDVLYVSGQEKSLAQARLLMYTAARQTLGNALTLLGLSPVTRM